MMLKLDFGGVQVMKKGNSLGTIFAVIGALVALAAGVAAVLYFLDKKKKDDEELERYLDCSIQ